MPDITPDALQRLIQLLATGICTEIDKEILSALMPPDVGDRLPPEMFEEK